MTELLLKIFVKDHSDTKNSSVHSAIGRLAGITGIMCNLLLFAGKFIVGIISGSVSVSADALNNLSDAMSSVVTLLGFRMAQQPADEDHPYGHARYEYVAGLILSAFILFVGFELIKSSVSKIINPVKVEFSAVMIGILIASVVVKLWMSLFYKNLGKRIGSVTLAAASADSRNDVLATSAVIIGCLAQYFFELKIDGYIGLVVAVFIIVSGVGIAKEEISLLLGKQVDEDTVENLKGMILSHNKILGIHDLLIHDYGPGRCYASVHAEFDSEESLIVCHDIADSIEKKVAEKMNIDLVIHFDPVVLDDEEKNYIEPVIKEIVKNINKDMSMHDFRIARKDGATKLIFDVFVPYDMSMAREEIKKAIVNGLSEKGSEYEMEIRFEGKK